MGAGLSSPVAADEPQWYVGGGLGLSQVKPDASDTPWRVSDDSDLGYKLTVGRELSDHLAVEAFWADLGNAEVAPRGRVDYKVYGAGVLLAFPDNNPGLSGFVKGGLVGIDANANLPHKTDNHFLVYGGLGAEYQLDNGLSLRGEYERYAEDAGLFSLNLVKRFGGEEEEVVEEDLPRVSLAPTVNAAVDDQDGDGVPDAKDRCPATPAGAPVNARGCPRFVGILRGVTFEPGSARLTPRAKKVLDAVARDMRKYPGHKFVVLGHTDNAGDALHNKRLSIQRARAVALYLVKRGISPKRLRYGGYGEAKPIASNDTPEGRARNRRVEIWPQS